MKNLMTLPILLCLIVLVSCTADSPSALQTAGNDDPRGNGDRGENYPTNLFFGFLDGGGSSNTYINMPIESSSTNLIVGRWKITKSGIDENNDGNIKYYNYQDYKHNECGLSFLQFNNNGVVFENSYYNDNGTCILYSEIDNWELLENNRIKIYVYNNIYLVKVTQSELILKYDWNFANSLYGPSQVYYYYEKIVEEN